MESECDCPLTNPSRSTSCSFCCALVFRVILRVMPESFERQTWKIMLSSHNEGCEYHLLVPQQSASRATVVILMFRFHRITVSKLSKIVMETRASRWKLSCCFFLNSNLCLSGDEAALSQECPFWSCSQVICRKYNCVQKIGRCGRAPLLPIKAQKVDKGVILFVLFSFSIFSPSAAVFLPHLSLSFSPKDAR